MKRIISFFLALMVFSFPVFALEGNAFNLEYADGVTLYSYESVKGEVLGMDAKEFKKYLNDNTILLFGVDDSNEFVFEITSEQTEFSNGVKDFENIKEADIKDFAQSAGFLSYSIETYGDNVYVVGEYLSDNSGNFDPVTQYVTVKQGKLYIITFTAAKDISAENTRRMGKIVSGIKYAENEAPQNVSMWSVIGLAVLILVIVGIAVYIIITIIKDIRKRNSESD